MTTKKAKLTEALRQRRAHKARLNPAMLLCAVGHRGTIGNDFDYVEILDARGPLLAEEMKRLLKAKAPYLSLDEFADRLELRAAMPKSCRGGFLDPGLWVLEGVPVVVANADHLHDKGIPLVIFKDTEKLTWRRPLKSDGWSRSLGIGRL